MAGPMLVTPGQTVGSSDWDALTQQHGGLPSVGQPLAPDDPANIDLLSRPGMAATLKQHPIYRYYFADGTYVDAYTDENGQDSHIVAYKPSARFTQQHPASGTAAGGTNTSIGTNPTSGQPTQVTTYPDGRPPTYDDTQVPSAQSGAAKPPEAQDQGGRHLVWQANPGGPNAGGKWVDVGPGPETPAERQAREANAPTQTVVTKQGGDGKTYTLITIVPKPGQTGEPGQITLGPDGKQVPTGIPGETPKPTTSDVVVDGIHYTKVTTAKPDGTVDIGYRGPDGKPIAALPSEPSVNPKTPAPRMPNFVLGGSQAALTQYKSDLQQGVSTGAWSQKWADDRWGEAIQLAQQVNQDYATQQRDVESSRAAAINLAQGRATLGQNAISSALTHVNQMNGLLPEGSSLGGQTFAALLGINMLMQARSGIDSINPNARPSQPLPTITPAQMASPQAMATVRADIAAQTAQAAAQATAAAPAASPAAAPRAQAPAAPTGRPTSAAPAQMTAEQAADYARRGINPSTGEPTGLPAAGAASPSPAPSYGKPGADPSFTSEPSQGVGGSVLPDPNAQQDTAATLQNQLGQPGDPGYVAPASTDPTVSDPNYTQPQYTPPTYVTRPADIPPGEVTRSPTGQEYPVLAQYAPQRQPAPAPPTAQPEYGVMANYGPSPTPQPTTSAQPSQYPAALQARARATEPWRLSTQEIQQMLDAGVPESDIWSVPGRQKVA